MSVDRNKTVWQRIHAAIEPTLGRDKADMLTAILHPVVLAERHDARTSCDSLS